MRILCYPLLFLCLLLTACKTDYPGQEAIPRAADAPVPVRVVALTPTTEPLPIEAGGTIGTKTEARLAFKVGGIIDRVYAREGQYVRKGATLARLKSTEIDARVAQARQARDQAKRDLERAARLFADSAATREQIEGLTTGLEVAESDLEIATFNQRYARITAPVGGRITRKLAEEGELVAAGSPVFLVSGEARDGYVLRVGVADRDLLALAPGDRAEVRLDAYHGQAVPARVTEIAAAADPATGTFEVELTLDGQGKVLRNGFIGRAKIFPSRTPRHFRVPLTALVEGTGNRVLVFSPGPDGRAVRHEVRMSGLLDQAFIVPAAELAAVDTLITAGAAYLTDGSPIIIQ